MPAKASRRPGSPGRSSEHRGPHAARLTAREVEILLAVSRGLTNEAIAQQLFLSPAIVARHLANIYNKISVRNRVEAANWAMTHVSHR
ncbi:MAG: response regulator transcription factor [Dehalococcoidia bacterium]|nr:DNA-binding response regulator [Chloroflexi bacterium CFX7]NUQ54659.1 response regulator transcription factor [Dehalococcoidia bacterium]